jgi:hypothetical protein
MAYWSSPAWESRHLVDSFIAAAQTMQDEAEAHIATLIMNSKGAGLPSADGGGHNTDKLATRLIEAVDKYAPGIIPPPAGQHRRLALEGTRARSFAAS